MAGKTLGVPRGEQWLLADWRGKHCRSAAETKRVANALRLQCWEGRYWLRAYAVLPARMTVLLYPLDDAAALLADLDTLAGDSGRIKPIRNDAELDRAARMVELLPVRLHLAARPEEYPLSSIGWISAPESSLPMGFGRPSRS